MATTTTQYRNQVLAEIEKTPVEHLPNLLRIIRIYRESISLKTAEESFKQGWQEALKGETKPVSEL